MSVQPEAFLLLSLERATVSSQGSVLSGVLGLECVTVPIPAGLLAGNEVHTGSNNRDVYLVLKLGDSFEKPIDPVRTITLDQSSSFKRQYVFHATESDSSQIIVTIDIPSNPDPVLLEDFETFDGILAQYADFRGYQPPPSTAASGSEKSRDVVKVGSTSHTAPDDLRGHLVLVNEVNGEVVGEFDSAQFRVAEDPQLARPGHENDAVVIEVPEGESGREQDASAMEMFVRVIPPDQQDWITKSATIVSHAISTTTNLLLTTVTAASNYYISHSAPSPYNTPAGTPGAGPTSAKSIPGTENSQPPPMPRALVFLTSESTRKGLANVHAVTGQAVKVSTQTISVINDMIQRAMGSRPKGAGRLANAAAVANANAQSSGSATPPPAYLAPGAGGSEKPALPPRRSPSPVPPTFQGGAPPSLPPRTVQGAPEPASGSVPPPLPPRLSKKARLLLSADLILSTIDHEARRAMDVGTERIGAVVGHKYGPAAAESSLLMAGSARNVGLVYVDMRGIGRRAILRRVGKEFVKGRMQSKP
ncbi:hypothetical protein HGRIS_014478 [Hohenbuehelia grisea]|uniref:Senescence domain-containing protein n=1 Tax=Hohenbuehelia grisea TaxID=104357 RepID=A0ABR3JU71_9AGAR